jgi:hypothetical protein
MHLRCCCWSAAAAAQVFETIGPVVELVVVRDKFTHESKGSAFVWYTNKADADKVCLASVVCNTPDFESVLCLTQQGGLQVHCNVMHCTSTAVYSRYTCTSCCVYVPCRQHFIPALCGSCDCSSHPALQPPPPPPGNISEETQHTQQTTTSACRPW